jgi:adenylate kinase family enzyme
MSQNRSTALLLLGPTGSGKTPLGSVLESHGLNGVPCVHFDFGENLRSVVANNQPDDAISRADIDFLKGVLAAGTLLEDERFPIAERILRSFLARRPIDQKTWIVLNGLPRHVGQASAMDAILEVRRVVCLDGSADVVVDRLESNIGGDRAGRSDDTWDAVQKKLTIYRQQTAPLVEFYRKRNVPIVTIPVTAAMTAEEARTMLERADR